jgi:hypothetical protein
MATPELGVVILAAASRKRAETPAAVARNHWTSLSGRCYPARRCRAFAARYWSAYWYNGYIYGAEMARGLDVFGLVPNEHLSQSEIDAAMSVELDPFNAQHQTKFVWPVSFAVSRSYLDQLVRGELIHQDAATQRAQLDQAERAAANQRRVPADQLVASASRLDQEALARLVAGHKGESERLRALLASSMRDLAATLR